MYLVASVHPFVCQFVILSVCPSSALPSAAKSNNPKSVAKESHYQSKVFVCVSVTSGADAVDQLLIDNGSPLSNIWPIRQRWCGTNLFF